jgi:hypothetical protein
MSECSPDTRPVILILSCAADRRNGRDLAARETWLRRWGEFIPCRFVYGVPSGSEADDEIAVEALDDYGDLWVKQRAAYRWAMKNDFSHVFICCNDTYVRVPQLLASGYARGDYIGRRCQNERYASGGAGYWLSRRSMVTAVLGQPPSTWPLYPDLVDGRILESARIPLIDDHRYHGHMPDPLPDDFITVHLSRGTGVYDPQWMRDLHARYADA